MLSTDSLFHHSHWEIQMSKYFKWVSMRISLITEPSERIMVHLSPRNTWLITLRCRKGEVGVRWGWGWGSSQVFRQSLRFNWTLSFRILQNTTHNQYTWEKNKNSCSSIIWIIKTDDLFGCRYYVLTGAWGVYTSPYSCIHNLSPSNRPLFPLIVPSSMNEGKRLRYWDILLQGSEDKKYIGSQLVNPILSYWSFLVFVLV